MKSQIFGVLVYSGTVIIWKVYVGVHSKKDLKSKCMHVHACVLCT